MNLWVGVCGMWDVGWENGREAGGRVGVGVGFVFLVGASERE